MSVLIVAALAHLVESDENMWDTLDGPAVLHGRDRAMLLDANRKYVEVSGVY